MARIPTNKSRINTLKTSVRKPTKKVAKKRRVGMYSTDKTGAKELLTPVGNTAPWTIGGPTLGGKANSKANLSRKRTVKNKAPKKRVPILGNTGTMGMMGF